MSDQTQPPNARTSVIFFGSPQMAVPALEKLLSNPQIEVRAVVTQTDKPSGRGQKLQASAVKTCALQHGIRVFQPVSLKKPEKSDGLSEFLHEGAAPDFFVVVAYGKIIPGSFLQIPRYGAINIHFSLLPRWRGAAPVQAAVLAGDKETGIGIMKMDEGLDTGPVYLTERLPIRPEDSSGSLAESLSLRGAILLDECIPKIVRGEISAIPQSDSGVTYAGKLTPADFQIDWTKDATVLAQQIQAGTPFPGARSMYEQEVVKLFSARAVAPLGHKPAPAGTVVECNKRELLIATGGNMLLSVAELQFPNRKRLPVAEIVKSKDFVIGSRFGDWT